MADIAFSCFTLAIWSHCCRLGDQLFGCKVNIIYQDRTQIQRSGHTVVDQLFGCRYFPCKVSMINQDGTQIWPSGYTVVEQLFGCRYFHCKVSMIYQDRTQIQPSGHTVVDQLFGCISIAKLPRWNPNVAGAKNRF